MMTFKKLEAHTHTQSTVIRVCKHNADSAEQMGFFADREQSCNGKSCEPRIK